MPSKRPGDRMNKETSTPQQKRPRIPIGLTPVKHDKSLFSNGKSNGARVQPPVAQDQDEISDREVYHDGSFISRGSDSDD
jgi:hypothetical protein